MEIDKEQGMETPAAGCPGPAQDRLPARRGARPLPRTLLEAQRLIDELSARQIELELQNEELRRARDEAQRNLPGEAPNESELWSLLHGGMHMLLEGFCIIELCFDNCRRPVDYRFLETNAAFESQTGLLNAKGRYMRDLAPEHEEHWFEIYGKVALTGEPARFENEAKALNRWYDVFAFRLGESGSRKVGILFKDISELKQTAQALQLSECCYDALFDNKIAGLAHCRVITDRGGLPVDYRYLQVNETYAGIMGGKKTDLVGRTLREVCPEHRDCQVDLVGIFGQVALERAETFFEAFCGCSRRFLSVYAYSPIPGEFVAIVTDVTERRSAEEALLRSEQRYRSVVQDQTELIARYRPDGSYLFVNEVYCRFYGKTEDEVVGDKWQPDAFADDLPVIEAQLKLLSPSHPVVLVENRVVSGRGEIRWMQFVNRAFFDERGALVETQAVGRDITEHKCAETALAQSQALLDSIIENTSEMIWSVDPDRFGLRSFNRSFGDYFLARRRTRTASGMRPEELYPADPESAGVWRDFYLRALEQGSFSTEYTVRDGRDVLELNFNLLLQNGTVFGISVFAKEISGRKKAEAALKRYAQRLIVLDEDLRKDLAAELHDGIAQLMTALGLNLANIGALLPREPGAKLLHLLADSRKLTREMGRAVRDLMSELRPVLLDEFGLCAGLRWHAEQYAKRTGIAVSVEIPPEFPRLAAKTESALFRICLEALANVSKHADAARVKIELRCQGDAVRLGISDDGRGFLPGEMVPPATGSGWGLTIMRERAELIGGVLTVDSALDAGTSVAIEIRGAVS